MATNSERKSAVCRSAAIFNDTVVASAIAAAFDLGLFDEIRTQADVSVQEFCDNNDLQYDTVRAILIALQTKKIVRFDPVKDQVSADDLFQQVCCDKGYFAWLLGGYGAMLQNLSEMARKKHRKQGSSNRCGQRIASAGRDYGAQFVDRYFQGCIDESHYSAVADVGCGSAERLIQMATANHELTGVGIEVDPGAVRLARSEIQRAGLEKRIQVVEGDVRNLEHSRYYEDVQIVFSFFMGHDLWPRQQCLLALQSVRRLFPNASRFLLCDTYRSQALDKVDIPIFTLGFEFTHMIMGDYVPTLDEWMELFEESAWDCVESHSIGIPFSCIFDLRAK